MPKNFKGGKKHKKGGKTTFQGFNKSKLRLAKEEGEIYAKCISVFGNGMAEVLCNDNVKRLLIIRRRFKGRNKRDNNVSVDTMLLVGLREWEVVAAKKKQKVDLLYVYSKSDLEDLKKLKNVNPKVLPDSVQVEIKENGPFDISKQYDNISDGENSDDDMVEPAIYENKNHKLDLDDLDFDDI